MTTNTELLSEIAALKLEAVRFMREIDGLQRVTLAESKRPLADAIELAADLSTFAQKAAALVFEVDKLAQRALWDSTRR